MSIRDGEPGTAPVGEKPAIGLVGGPLEEAVSTADSAVTVRSILLGLALVGVDNAWVLNMERVYGSPVPTTISLFMNVVFILVVLQIINAGIRRIAPGLLFRRMELLTIYSMVTLGAALAGLDSVSIIPQVSADPIQLASPTNHWAVTIWPHLSKWLTVRDLPALKSFYLGNSTLYTAAHIRAWATPVAAWTLFVMLLLWVMLCLNVLVRRQWQDHERLSYPLIQLPIEMTRPGGHLYRQRPFLIGAVLAGLLDLVNGFATWYPNVPSFHVWGVDLALSFPNRPWNAIWWMPLNYFPFVVGLGFLLPIDLIFSCWFFYLFWKLERVALSSGGWDTSSNFPYINEQCFGAYVALVGFSIWAGRSTYRQVYERAMKRSSEVDDSGEGMPYRTAFFGTLAGMAALTIMSWAAGLAIWASILFFILFFILMIAIGRIRAELGPPVHDLHFTGPDHMIPMAVGTRNLNGSSLAVLSLFFWFNRAYRSSPMPVQTEALAIGRRMGADQRRLTLALLLAGFVGTFGTLWIFLHMGYEMGVNGRMRGGSGMGYEGFTRMDHWLNNLEGPNWAGIAAMVVGAAIGLALMIAHTQIPGWPLHAMGFAISGSWSMNLVWFPLFMAWVLKLGTIRYAGIKGYRVALTFFMGLIVGEAIVGIGWAFVRLFNDQPIYNFFGS